jgi:hypothetical protein
MNFEALVELIENRVHLKFPGALLTITDALAVWERDGYGASVLGRANGAFVLRFAIDGEGEELQEFDGDSEDIETSVELVLMVLAFSRTRHFLGTALGDDPRVTGYGDAWSYLDDNGRKIFGGRFLRHDGVHFHDEIMVCDRDTGANGLPLPDYLRDPRPSAQHKEEAEDVAHLLLAACDVPSSLVIDDKPDIHADLWGTGQRVYVEHARIVIQSTLELQAGVDALNNRLSSTVLRAVSLEIGLPQNAWRPRLSQIHDELIEYSSARLETTQHDRRLEFDDTFPELHRSNAAYIVRSTDGNGRIHVRVTGTYDDARILAAQVQRTLVKKIGKSAGYVNRPLWLALFVRDERGYNEFALNALEHRAIEFAPFEELIFGDSRGIIKLSATNGHA